MRNAGGAEEVCEGQGMRLVGSRRGSARDEDEGIRLLFGLEEGGQVKAFDICGFYGTKCE